VNRFIEELAVRRPRLGKAQSLAGALGIIHSYKAKKIPLFLAVEFEAGKIEGPFVLAVFGNIRYWATGRMINPAARPDDGRLDACLVRPCSLPRLARLSVLSRKGRHLGAREVEVQTSCEYRVSSEHPFQVQADGEIIRAGQTAAFKKIQFTVIRQALNVICRMGPRT
jgi:diacylglycerol kinase (ATP)